MKDKLFEVFNENAEPFFSYEQLLDALSTAIIVTDRSDKLVYQNKKSADVFGNNFTSAEKSMKEIVEREDWNIWNENLFKLSNYNNNNSTVFNLKFKDSSGIKYFKFEGRVFKRDKNNKPCMYFFAVEDITQQFKDENKMLSGTNLSIGWKNFVSKTSAEKKLELAIKDLDRSNKDLEEFAYIASHDLQEPLRKITSFSSRLTSKFHEQLGEEGKLYIDKINIATGNMKELIENLLQISRTVQHSQPFETTNLNSIVDSVRQNLDLKIEEGNVQITHETLPEADALPSLMMQLFNNIISNAIKFSSKNQIAVIHISSEELSTAEKDSLLLPSNKTYYKIAVKDNGIGFQQESAKDIFKIFYRLNSKAEYPGTGIGLAICNKIVEKHKGVIWAESEPDKGAAFFIVLPKNQDDRP